MNRRLAPLLTGLLAVLLVLPARAQDAATLLTSQRRPVEVSVGLSYQQLESDSISLGQFSLPVMLRVPIGRFTEVSLVVSQAATSGTGYDNLSGLSNLLLTASHGIRLGSASAVGSLGLGLPTGTTGLTDEEFTTAVEVGRNVYGFQVQALGQGLEMAPSLVMAVPLTSNIAAGLGVSYLYHGAYEPIQGVGDYDPGDEVLLTGGFDARVGRTSVFGIDVTLTWYGSDWLGGEEVFRSGGKTRVVAQYRRRSGPSDLRIWGLYRSRATSETRLGAVFLADEARTPPGQTEVHGRYGMRLGPRWQVAGRVGARLFEAVDAAGQEAMQVFFVGLEPTLRVSPSLRFEARVAFNFGSVTGPDVGLRSAITL